MQSYLQVAQILVSVVLIVLILAQTRGMTAFGGAFSSDSSIFRTRRGLEKTLFQFTIGIALLFLVLAIVTVLVAKTA
ncbi:MAG: preprotein translocase subunit SecG [Chloroflexi bacterium]|nr:preprotein translocase subunit SecG [Chloroflexota bacterium]